MQKAIFNLVIPILLFNYSGKAQSISSHDENSLFLKKDGTVCGAGGNYYGALGSVTSSSEKSTPIQVDTLTGITAIEAGGFHSFFIRKDSTVWASGWNHNGQLGDGTNTPTYTPIQIKSLSGIVAISADHSHSFFFKT